MNDPHTPNHPASSPWSRFPPADVMTGCGYPPDPWQVEVLEGRHPRTAPPGPGPGGPLGGSTARRAAQAEVAAPVQRGPVDHHLDHQPVTR